jgi:hypothetical protein
MAAKNPVQIDALRTKAWFAEVLVASGTTSAYQLKNKATDERGRAIKYDYYRTGERVPSDETLGFIEEMYGSAPSVVFRKGPEGTPLWDVLYGDEAGCHQAVLGWLAGTDHRMATDRVAKVFTTLGDQVVLAFEALGVEMPKRLGDSPGFLHTYELTAPLPKSDDKDKRYYRPELAEQARSKSTPWLIEEERPAFLTRNEVKAPPAGATRAAFVTLAASSPIASLIRNHAGPYPAPKTAVLPDAVSGVFALRTLAVMRGELLRETAFLLEIVRPLVREVFQEWNIGEDVAEFIRPD